MNRPLHVVASILFVSLGLQIVGCLSDDLRSDSIEPGRNMQWISSPEPSDWLFKHIVEEDISVKEYFSWIESLAIQYDSLVPYYLHPQLLVHANPWVIDSFAQSDYYRLMDRGIFVYDQPAWKVLYAGDTLVIPAPHRAEDIEFFLRSIRIDINLPEYTLRLWSGIIQLDSFPVRIGQHRTKYLESEGRDFDLHTRIGTGSVVDIILSPTYTNFNTGEAYTLTRRDDGETTLMPLIPTLEPEINGLCHGQLIHPTTNPNTLGKAYSHGCIGTKEGDAWRIYFHAQIGTPVRVRYELTRIDMAGDTLRFPDVYGLGKSVVPQWQTEDYANPH